MKEATRAAWAIAILTLSACADTPLRPSSRGIQPIVLQPFRPQWMDRTDASFYRCPFGYTLACNGTQWRLLCVCTPW
jgi:hypothetical protein